MKHRIASPGALESGLPNRNENVEGDFPSSDFQGIRRSVAAPPLRHCRGRSLGPGPWSAAFTHIQGFDPPIACVRCSFQPLR